MIRRPLGTDHWILIPQIAHARLAGQLAEHWRLPAFGDLQPHDELVAAIAHHDDGWENWDRHPSVAQGKPISFLEMPLGEATAIWRASIERASELGPAAGYVVAGHFCALLERSAAARADSPSKGRLAEAFLTAYRRRMQAWLAVVPAAERAMLERCGVASLQFFDAVSLWLCCDERTASESFATPGGPLLTFTPQSAKRLVVEPWPFEFASLSLVVEGRQIPQFHYADEADLAAAPAESVQLRFELAPNENNPGKTGR